MLYTRLKLNHGQSRKIIGFSNSILKLLFKISKDIRSEYWTIKEPHPTWTTVEVIHWLIEIVDEVRVSESDPLPR